MDLTLSPVSPHENAYEGHGELHWLNAMKFICSLMVVMIHTDFFWRAGFMPINRVAVPFFLMVSGFFLPGAGAVLTQEKTWRVFLHILKVTVGLQILYFFFKLFMFLGGAIPSCPAIDLSPKFILLTIFEGDLYAAQTWYLNSYLIALALIYIFLRYRCEKVIYWLVLPGLALNMICGDYYWGPPDTMPGYLIRNFLFTSLPFITIGVWIRRHASLIPRWTASLTAMLLCVPFLYIESYLVGYETGDLYLMSIPVSVLFFMTALKAPDSAAPRWLASAGRNLSAGIFYYHYLFVIISKEVLNLGGWSFLAVGVCSIALAAAVRELQKHIKLPKLNIRKNG